MSMATRRRWVRSGIWGWLYWFPRAPHQAEQFPCTSDLCSTTTVLLQRGEKISKPFFYITILELGKLISFRNWNCMPILRTGKITCQYQEVIKRTKINCFPTSICFLQWLVSFQKRVVIIISFFPSTILVSFSTANNGWPVGIGILHTHMLDKTCWLTTFNIKGTRHGEIQLEINTADHISISRKQENFY